MILIVYKNSDKGNQQNQKIRQAPLHKNTLCLSHAFSCYRMLFCGYFCSVIHVITVSFFHPTSIQSQYIQIFPQKKGAKREYSLFVPLIPDQSAPGKIRFAVIEKSCQAAYQPACRISHANGKNLIIDIIGHNIQIELPEYHKGCQHNNHRRSAVARSSECACINLIHTAENIERCNVV